MQQAAASGHGLPLLGGGVQDPAGAAAPPEKPEGQAGRRRLLSAGIAEHPNVNSWAALFNS